MSYVDPEPEGKPLFEEPAYVDQSTRRRRLIPALILAVPMVVAFVGLLFTEGSMNSWAVSGPRIAAGQYQLIVLHMFAHGGIGHIVFNMTALVAFAPSVMERLGPLEPRSVVSFIVLFVGCGLAGLGLWLAINPASEIPMLGASGAIFGFLGVILRQPDPHAPSIPIFSRRMGEAFITFGKMHLPLIAFFAIPLLLGSDFFGLAWEAHLGGFIGGILLGAPLIAWCGNRPDWIPSEEAD